MLKRDSSQLLALDTGRSGSFDALLTECLDNLKKQLLQECDRIAINRELALKRQLQRAENEILLLRSQHSPMPVDEAIVGSGKQEAPVVDVSMVEPTGLIDEDPAQASADNGEGISAVPAAPDVEKCERVRANVGSIDDGAQICDLSLSPEQTNESEANPTKSSYEFELWDEWKGDILIREISHSASHLEMQFSKLVEEGCLAKASARSQRSISFGNEREEMSSPCTVPPGSTRAVCWEVVGALILFYDLTTIPLAVFHRRTDAVANVMSWVLVLYWTADMFLRFFVFGYTTRQGMVELRRKLMMKNYVRTSFFFDLLMVVPDWLSKLMENSDMRNVAILRAVRIFRIARLLRMAKLKKLVRVLEDAIDSQFLMAAINLCLNILAIVGVSHYLACIWFWIGTASIDGYPSWVAAQDLGTTAWEYQYAVCLHWAITQFTPGSSRLQPVNVPETIFAMVVLILGVVFLSVFISGITQERVRLHQMTGKLEREQWILRKFLRQNGVSSQLVHRASRYVDAFVAHHANTVQAKDVVLLKALSIPLQHEIQEEMFYQTLDANPFLKALRRKSLALTLHLFVNVIGEMNLADMDTLFEAAQLAHEMFWVRVGTLAYLQMGRDVTQADEVEFIYQNTGFCEPVLWVPWVHKGTVKATSRCHLISIDSSKMRAAVLEHKERLFVRRCAHGYLKDLNAYFEDNGFVTDTIQISTFPDSAYSMAIHGR